MIGAEFQNGGVDGSFYVKILRIFRRLSPAVGSAVGSVDPTCIRLCLYYEVSEKRLRCYGANPYGELETYLTARFEYIVEPEFDVLKWWSRMTMQFPVMSLIAKGILAAPALTVSVAQAFGTGGYALDWQMSNYLCQRPHSPLTEKQMLLGDWTKAEDRNENDYDDVDGYMIEEIFGWELDDY